ncbi:hypothetical protein HK101_005655 [Irineochytrium annulatum]|nr:hypothetical protein HK101_005655 [Irineochytrium annulatum]
MPERYLDQIAEEAIWTVVGVEQIEYTFWLPPTSLTALRPATPTSPTYSAADADRFNPLPAPTVFSFKCLGTGMYQILGVNFTSRLRAFFGRDMASRTEYRNSELLDVDAYGLFNGGYFAEGDQEGGRLEPILLVRDDGVVYRTGFYTRVSDML